MIAFLARRFGQAVVVTFAVATLTFILILAAPGSPIYKKPTLGLDLRGGLVLNARQYVRIAFERKRNARMPELLGNDLY